MPRSRFNVIRLCVAACCLTVSDPDVNGQEPKSGLKGGLPVAAAGDQVIVKREASRIIDPHKYRIPLSLEPIRTVTLTAPFDGLVKQISGKPNSKVQPQGEIVRLDTTIARLQLLRAEANSRVVAGEAKLVSEKDDAHKAVAAARLELANAELAIVKYNLELCGIRAPFAGELQRILVTDGQFVKAGDPVAIVVDVGKLLIEIPAERSLVEVGKTMTLKIETTDMEGKVDAVLPLNSRFDGLRELFDSVASAVIVVENLDGRFKPGQSVYVPLIPRQPVVEVQVGSIGNLPDGERKVQVVRQSVVRDVPVLLMGSVGVNRVFVSGPFADGDEVITESSHQLGDAFQLKQSTTNGSGSDNSPASAGGTKTPKTGIGF